MGANDNRTSILALLQECADNSPSVADRFGTTVREPEVLEEEVSCVRVEAESRRREVMFIRDQSKSDWISVLPPQPTAFDPWEKCHPHDFVEEDRLGNWMPAYRSESDQSGLYYKIQCGRSSYAVRCMMRECKYTYSGMKIGDKWYIGKNDLCALFCDTKPSTSVETVYGSNSTKRLQDAPNMVFPWVVDGKMRTLKICEHKYSEIGYYKFILRDVTVCAFVDRVKRKMVIVQDAQSNGVTFADIYGMDSLKTYVKTSVIAPLRDPERAKKYGLRSGGGLLLYGLPGTGKTFFARAVAGELNVPFFSIGSNDIFGKYIGDSEKKIKAIFAKARTNPMSIIFIDEIDAILKRRSDDLSETRQDVVNIILQECDGINSKAKNPFFLIGATNYPLRIDEAAMSRFGTAVEVPLPEAAAREAILRSELYKMDVDVDTSAISWIVSMTEGWSMRDICVLASHYRQQAYVAAANEITKDFCCAHFKNCKTPTDAVSVEILAFKKRISAL